MGLFSFLSSSKSSDKALDGIINGIDALFLTEEERVKYNQQASELWLKIQESVREEGSVRSLTRRYIAIVSLGSYIVLAMAAALIYPFDEPWSKFLLDLMNGHLGWLVLGIGGFYFGPTMIGRMKK